MKKTYTIYELREKSEGVDYYEILISDEKFYDLEYQAITYNDATPYDNRKYVKHIMMISLNKEEYENMKTILYLASRKLNYNEMKGGLE